MSVSSTERLNRQLQDVQSGEYDDWLKSTGSKKFEDSLDSKSIDINVDEQHADVEEEDTGNTATEETSSSRKGGLLRPDVHSPEDDYGATAEKIPWFPGHRKPSIQAGIKSPWKYSPASELEERKMMLASLDHEIEMESKRSKNRLKNVNRGWDKMSTKQKGLIDALRKFNTVIQDCRDKREELSSRFEIESTEGRKSSKIVNDYKRQLKALNDLMATTEKRVDNHFMFESLLREVKEQGEGRFKSIRDVINRAIILESIRRRLMDWERENQEEYRFSIQDLPRIYERSSRNVWKLSGTLTEACERSELIANELKIVENQLDVEKLTKQKENMVSGQLQLAVQNLHIEISRQLFIKPKIPSPEPEEQLKSISLLVAQLRRLSKDIRANAEMKSDEVAIEVDTQALEKEQLKYKM